MTTIVLAHADAQALRSDGTLRAAQEKPFACPAEGCPALVRPGCGRWIEEVRVPVDGVAAEDALDGKEVAVDPGAHAIAFERRDHGRVIETSIVMKESEKARVVAMPFPGDAIAAWRGVF